LKTSGDDDLKLRPQYLSEFIGQTKVKENLKIAIQAAKARNEALDHVLLFGGPGLGKTTLANILANELGVKATIGSAALVKDKFALLGVFKRLQSDNEVFFMDEIHRLRIEAEEALYSILEDFKMDIVTPLKTREIKIRPFTFVGATTRAGGISAPLRARFGIVQKLDYYPFEDLKIILLRTADVLKLVLDSKIAEEIARRSRGTPRIANRLLRRVRDYAEVVGDGSLDLNSTEQAFKMLEIDNLGLDELDRRILSTIVKKYDGGPVGIANLSTMVGEDPETIEDVCEPFLVQSGLIKRTPQGRVVTLEGHEHIGEW
jgi:Holliday junction DNA helicase RuvB